MANFSGGHDAYFIIDGTTQQLAVTSATGTSTTAFGTQTRAVQVLNASTFSTIPLHVKFYNVGTTSQATSTADCPVPCNWIQVYKVIPGQRASFIMGGTASCIAYVTELTD